MNNVVLIMAAGNSVRFAADLPKQYNKVNGKTLLRWAIEAFLQNKLIDKIVVVINEEHLHFYENSTEDIGNMLEYTLGGDTRKKSVASGLQYLQKFNPVNVLIHDAARPLVSQKLINRVVEGLDICEAVDVGLQAVDTIKYEKPDGIEVLEREKVYATQTPQGFKFETISTLHQNIQGDYTDDISICLENQINIKRIEGERSNIKITNWSDFEYFKFIKKENKVYRTGLGTDVHRFSEFLESDVMIKICGIEVAHNQLIIAHSDGDVGFHAITEALLGAMALGNIGQIFPDNDGRYKNMDSAHFLIYARNELRKLCCEIVNIDLTIICEKPRIMPHSQRMRKNIADVLEIEIYQVSVKATTTEKMGFLGNQNGIAAQAICTVIS
ncbi:2-C-methyl-D-erythritol 2,4-cyclodiphosphate synthase [Candidatus Bandiella euplotis]|uniref:Bifunctional enzyme IspD/IspF n=1 Tax=Candidatus Bandiella euplotis TaxID=1664265 RepID=A0ABZ0UJW3_9RICK|nr:2-C-methyl-D-erythritol 2,4-cyclodiphosphate synthase [Candidatus Bandiella woodruffii]WPX95947.1 Bifunctional enzyme IspD/IspF [Candidatus Bandiella woodruffii]